LTPRVYNGPHGKSTYKPVRTDKRSAGARSRSYAAKYSKEKSGNSLRNLVPGAGDIGSLSKMSGLGTGIYEQEEPTYILREQIEEDKLFEINSSVRNLLKDLKDKEEKSTGIKDENKAQ
jgi:hypothetical protein